MDKNSNKLRNYELFDTRCLYHVMYSVLCPSPVYLSFLFSLPCCLHLWSLFLAPHYFDFLSSDLQHTPVKGSNLAGGQIHNLFMHVYEQSTLKWFCKESAIISCVRQNATLTWPFFI